MSADDPSLSPVQEIPQGNPPTSPGVEGVDAPAGGAASPGPAPWTCVKSVGTAVDRNARYRRTMEDEHIALDSFSGNATSGYFAIYDGHGGRQVVERVKAHLHLLFEEELKKLENNITGESVKEAWTTAYSKMDGIIRDEKIMFSGTTAAAVLLLTVEGKRKAFASNAGDARIVLIKDKQGVRLTYDHKASDPSEVQRVHDAGGFVIMNRVNGMLAVTRALGDLTMKDHVSCEPYCSETELDDSCTHLIVACDGIWDVLSDDDASKIVVEASSSQDAARQLLRQSLKLGSTDNISVMVVEL